MINVELKDVVSKMQKRRTGDMDLVSISGFSPEEIIVMRENPDVFFFATKARVVLVSDVMKATRELFKVCGYGNISLSMELYQYVREKYATKAFNKPGFANLFDCNGSLTYMDFIMAEKKYADILNELVDSDSKIVIERDLVAEMKSILSNKKQYEILDFRSKGLTLDMAGEKFGVTRERIRQIETTPKKSLIKWLNVSATPIMEKYCINGQLISEKIVKDFGEDFARIMFYVIRTAKHIPENHWLYMSLVDAYFYSLEFSSIEDVLERIKNIEVDFNDVGSFDDIKDNFAKSMISAGLTFFTPEMVEPYLENKDFKIAGQKTYNRRITLGEGIRLVVKNDFPNGVKVSCKEDVNKVYSLLEKKYDIHSCKGRALITRMQSVLVMKDRTTYDLEERISCPDEIKNRIIDYIYTMDEDRIPYSALFKEFKKDLLSKTNIDNFYYLHGAVRLWTESDENIICLQHYVCRKTDDSIPRSKEYFKKFNDYLIEKGRPVDINEILTDFPHFNKMYVKYAIIYYDNIISWGPGAFADKNSIKIDPEDSPKFKAILDKMTDNPYKYISAYAAIEQLKKEFPEFLSKYMITSIYTLSNIISVSYDDYFVKNPHIVHDNKITSFGVESLVDMIFSGDTLDKREALDVLKTLYGKTNTVFAEAIRNRMTKYAKIAPGKYVLKSKVALNKSEQEQLRRFITSHIENDKYYLPISTKNYEGLPHLFVDWSPWLICELVKEYGLGFVVVKNASIQTDNLILGIVTKESGITTKEELFKYLYFNVYDGAPDDASLIKYARKTGLFGNSFVENSVKQIVR